MNKDKSNIRLRITQEEDCIRLEAIKGIDHFGFGTFLCDIKPEEIECDEFSKQALLNAGEQSGLNGLEIWADNRIAWGDPKESILMPIKEISKEEGCDWLKQIVTV